MKMTLLSLMILLVPALAFSQASKGAAGDSETKDFSQYRLAVRYNVNVIHNFIFHEETDITRTFSDDTQVEYKRNVTYFLTIVQNSLPEDGFNRILVSIDSLRYVMNENGVEQYNYDSQDEEAIAPYRNLDFAGYATLLGREFSLTYSPYNEVAKIHGDELEDLRRRINDKLDGIQDPTTLYLWNRYIADPFVTFVSDIQKNLIPSEFVTLDTTWIRPIELFANGIRFKDTVSINLKEFSPRQYVVVSEFDNITAIQEPFIPFGINEIVTFDEAEGSGTATITVSPRGQINSTEFTLETKYKARIGKEQFTEHSKTRYIWQLDKMFR